MVTKPRLTGQETDGRKSWLLWLIGEQACLQTDAMREVGLTWQQLSVWKRNDPQFAEELKDALEGLYERKADALLRIHDDVYDVKAAKIAGENLRWWLERRHPEKFGAKVAPAGGEQLQLVGILQAAVNRLIDAVPVPVQSLPVVDAQSKQVTFREHPTDKHRP